MQDIFNIKTALIDGQLAANFSRSLNTGDLEDDLDLSKCQYFIFLHSGGQLEVEGVGVQKHMETPISSDSQVCFIMCFFNLIQICLSQCNFVSLTSSKVLPDTTTKINEKNHLSTKNVSKTLVTESAQSQTKAPPTTTKLISKKTQQETDILLAKTKLFKIPEIRPINYHLFDVVLRIINEKWSAELEDSSSVAYHKMSSRIKAAV